LLDPKAKGGLSISAVDHLRWNMKYVFDMAVAEGHVGRNPALLLFTPREAKKPVHRAMRIRRCQYVLALSINGSDSSQNLRSSPGRVLVEFSR
jgi:hypothetical protein